MRVSPAVYIARNAFGVPVGLYLASQSAAEHTGGAAPLAALLGCMDLDGVRGDGGWAGPGSAFRVPTREGCVWVPALDVAPEYTLWALGRVPCSLFDRDPRTLTPMDYAHAWAATLDAHVWHDRPEADSAPPSAWEDPPVGLARGDDLPPTVAAWGEDALVILSQCPAARAVLARLAEALTTDHLLVMTRALEGITRDTRSPALPVRPWAPPATDDESMLDALMMALDEYTSPHEMLPYERSGAGLYGRHP